MAKGETIFKRDFVKKLVGFWTESYEPSRGTGVGIADIQVLCRAVFEKGELVARSVGKTRLLVPLEMKVGTVSDGTLFPEDIRADQIGWHFNFSRAGGLSYFVVGVKSGKEWQSYFIEGHRRGLLMDAKKGINLSDCIKVEFGL